MVGGSARFTPEAREWDLLVVSQVVSAPGRSLSRAFPALGSKNWSFLPNAALSHVSPVHQLLQSLRIGHPVLFAKPQEAVEGRYWRPNVEVGRRFRWLSSGQLLYWFPRDKPVPFSDCVNPSILNFRNVIRIRRNI